MHRFPLLLAVVLSWSLLAGDARAQSPQKPPFSFYGLRFGMTKDEVSLLFRSFDGRYIREPGHTIESIEVNFDREGTVMEFKASYLKPADPLEIVGLQRALRERWVVPMSAAFPDIAVSLDEYGNRAGITVGFLATGIRERSIEHYKKNYLQLFQ